MLITSYDIFGKLLYISQFQFDLLQDNNSNNNNNGSNMIIKPLKRFGIRIYMMIYMMPLHNNHVANNYYYYLSVEIKEYTSALMYIYLDRMIYNEIN